MSVRFNVSLSDDLNKAIDAVVEKNEATKADILRKALQLYLAAHAGIQEGKKVGLVNAETKQMETEFVGL